MARTGRRTAEAGGTGTGTREAILAAARAAFGERGYDGATMRGIAAAAGVDAALLHHYHGTKEELFTAAMHLPVDPATVIPQVLAAGPDGVGERLVRTFLGVWDAPGHASPFVALIRSAVSNERAAGMVRQFITRVVIRRIVGSLDTDNPELRATLVGSQMVGLAMARYVLRLEPLASATTEEVVAAVAPTIQRYLTGEIAPPLDGAQREVAPEAQQDT